ncbi:MAG: hypothetical protein RL470_372 [Actinomycetota bacterium]
MVKKSSPVEKAARLLDLVPYISSHQGIPTSELASEFGITVDELLDDLNSLWMCGDNRFDLIDLEFESGYVTIRNADTLNLIRSLSQQEVVALLIGLDLVEKGLSADRGDLIQDISALRSKLGKSLVRLVDATPAQDGQIISLLRESLNTQRNIEITYFAPTDDELTKRVVTPLQISTENDRDFLIAYCHSASAQRTFRIDRIQSAKILEEASEAISLSSSEDLRISAKIHITRNLRHSRELLGNYVTGEGSDVTVSTYSSGWLSRTVISSAGAMELRSSSELRSHIADIAERTLALYR